MTTKTNPLQEFEDFMNDILLEEDTEIQDIENYITQILIDEEVDPMKLREIAITSMKETYDYFQNFADRISSLHNVFTGRSLKQQENTHDWI
jgi:hypothetical protein